EARPGVAGLGAEDPIELGRVTAALVDLEVELRRVEDDGEATGRALRRAEQSDRLLGERPGAAGEVEAADVLVAGGLERSAVGVRVAPALVLVALDGVGLHTGPDVGEGLLGPAAVGRGEGARLALGVVASLGERDAVDAPSGIVCAEEVADLLLQ